MNNTQSHSGLSAMIDSANFTMDPGALLQQHSYFENDTASSRTTSSSSVPRLPTPDTDLDDEDDEDDDQDDMNEPTKRSTRGRNAKMPTATSSSRKSTKTSPTKSKSAAGGAAEKRRKRNLERNRAAASKCRQRKKQWQDGLERKKTELESRYKSLHSETKDLMEEIAQLKNLVMAHAGCNDANIDDWIRNEADSFVRRMSTAQRQISRGDNHNHAAVSSAPGTSASVSMDQLHSPATDASMNEALSNMFAPPGSKAPFDSNNSNNLRPNVTDNHIFNQDLLMISSMRA